MAIRSVLQWTSVFVTLAFFGIIRVVGVNVCVQKMAKWFKILLWFAAIKIWTSFDHQVKECELWGQKLEVRMVGTQIMSVSLQCLDAIGSRGGSEKEVYVGCVLFLMPGAATENRHDVTMVVLLLLWFQFARQMHRSNIIWWCYNRIVWRYEEALLSLATELLRKLQFRFNQSQLEELDDEVLDDDVRWWC